MEGRREMPKEGTGEGAKGEVEWPGARRVEQRLDDLEELAREHLRILENLPFMFRLPPETVETLRSMTPEASE